MADKDLFGETHPPRVSAKKFAEWAAEIYEAYSRKADRPHAIRSIVKALKQGKIAPDVLLLEVQRYAASEYVKRMRREGTPEYIPHCGSWVNGERWNDEIEPADLGSPIRNCEGKFCPKCGKCSVYWPTDTSRKEYKCKACGHVGSPR